MVYGLSAAAGVAAFACACALPLLAIRSRLLDRVLGLDVALRLHDGMMAVILVLGLLHAAFLRGGPDAAGSSAGREAGATALACIAVALLVRSGAALLVRPGRGDDTDAVRRGPGRRDAARVLVRAGRGAADFCVPLFAALHVAGKVAPIGGGGVAVLAVACAAVPLLLRLAGTAIRAFPAPLPWKVSAVILESPLVTTLRFVPDGDAGNTLIPSWRPGQFVFLRFASPGLPGGERPFTISSSPYDPFLAVTVKAAGNFSHEVCRVRVGNRAFIDGPWGRFGSALLRPAGQNGEDGCDLVLIAGGIGVTPFLSLLGWFGYAGTERRILLVWGARTHEDLIAREDFRSFARTLPGLSVIPVLTHDPLWHGERGRLDREKLARLIAGWGAAATSAPGAAPAGSPSYGVRKVPRGFEEGVLARVTGDGGENGRPGTPGAREAGFDWNAPRYLVSGPSGFSRTVRAALRSLGVRRSRIGEERFEL